MQDLEFYDRIMLLVGEKFSDIVKVGETIEDGLKTGKIACVAALPRSSRLLEKKREKKLFLSLMKGGRPA